MRGAFLLGALIILSPVVSVAEPSPSGQRMNVRHGSADGYAVVSCEVSSGAMRDCRFESGGESLTPERKAALVANLEGKPAGPAVIAVPPLSSPAASPPGAERAGTRYGAAHGNAATSCEIVAMVKRRCRIESGGESLTQQQRADLLAREEGARFEPPMMAPAPPGARATQPPPPRKYPLWLYSPEWEARPTPGQFRAAYPRGAEGVRGVVLVECAVDARGFLRNCAVVTESPANQGFGAGALRLASAFRMRREDVAKIPGDNRAIRLSIVLSPKK